MKKLIRIATGLIVAHLAGSALAQLDPVVAKEEGSKLSWQVSPYTLHFTQDDEHKEVLMVGMEREHANGKLDGFTFFTNSFGQPTVYLYPWGSVYHNLAGIKPLSFKWTAGLLYGYKDPYADKVPYNHNGFSPAAIIAFAYEFQSGLTAQVDMLGNNGLMFQLNIPYK